MKTKEEIAIKHGFIKGMSVHSRTDLIEGSLYVIRRFDAGIIGMYDL